MVDQVDFSSLLDEALLEDYEKIPIVCPLHIFEVIELKGKDVLSFLQRITTNDVMSLSENEMRQTIFASDKGRIIDLVHLVHYGEKFLLICHKIHCENLVAWLKKYVILEDIEISLTQQYFIWQCWSFCQENNAISFKKTTTENVESFFVVAKKSEEKNILQQTKSDFPRLKYWSFNTYEHYRIMHLIVGPDEINDQINPHEAHLIHLVDFDKGCYIGQEVIARLDTYDKVKKYLCKFECDLTKIEKESLLFDKNGKKAGFITSFLHNQNKSQGLMYVSKKYLQEQKLFLEDKNTVRVCLPIEKIG